MDTTRGRRAHRRMWRAVSAYVDSELPAADRMRMQAHLRECWDCGEQAEVLAMIKTSLRRRARRLAPLELARLRRFSDRLGQLGHERWPVETDRG